MIPDYMWGPLTTIGVFLIAQVVMFFSFLWRQSVLVKTIQQSLLHLSTSFDKYTNEHGRQIEIVHGRVTSNAQKIERHQERIEEHGRQISHINGVLNIRVIDKASQAD